MTRPIRWALLGASDIAASRVLPAIRADGGEAVVVRSADGAHAERYAAEHQIPTSTDSVAEAVGRDDVDAVYVSSRNEHHREQVVAAAEAGKHVLAEKPLALRLEDARSMVSACEAAGVVMATNHHLPASPVHRRMKELVADGAIGGVRAIHVNHAVGLPDHLRGWRVEDPVGGGVVLDVFIHDMAAVAAIVGGQARSVMATARKASDTPLAPNSVMTVVEWCDADGREVIVQTHDAYDNYDLPTGLDLLGDVGAIRSTASMTGDPVGDVMLYRGHQATPIEIPDRPDLYLTGVRAFHEAVQTGTAPLVTATDGLRSLAAALAAQASLGSGAAAAVVQVP